MFKNSITIGALGFALAACSPVAPSVSKMSNANAAAQKTAAVSNASNRSNAPAAQNASATPAAVSANQSVAMESVVLPSAGFSRQWSRIRAMHPSYEIEDSTRDELLKQNTASFVISDSRIRGHENEMLNGKTRIYVTVDADNANIAAMRLNEVPVSVTFKSDGDGERWEISLDQPRINGSDPVSDINEADRILNDFQKHVKGIAIEFQH